MNQLLPYLIVLIVLYFSFRVYLSIRRSSYEKNLETTVLRVAVGKLNERGPLVAEQIFSALHGIEAHFKLWDYLGGHTPPRISLEIASVKNRIQFFIWCPRRLKNVVSSQIYAQYPDVEIMEVEDYAAQPFPGFEAKIGSSSLPALAAEPSKSLAKYNAPHQKYCAVTAELQFEDPDIYPIKRYTQFEDKLTRLPAESLAGVTATLSKLNATDEQAWIQFVIRPVGAWWKHRGLHCLKIVSGGLFNNIFWLKKFATNVYLVRGTKRIFLSPFYFLFWALRGFRGTSLDMKSADSEDLKEEVSRSHDREDPIGAAVDKVTRLCFDASIRFVYILRAENSDLAEVKLREIAGSFKQYNLPSMNGFTVARLNEHNAQLYRRYQKRLITNPMILNTEEVATLYHMPHMSIGTPNVVWVHSKKLEPPGDLPIVGTVPENELTILGETNFRGHREKFGIKQDDRRRHVYIIGKTGMGKSVLLQNMLQSDIVSGKAVAVVDPHGDLAEAVIDFVPSSRTNDVVILDPSDVAHPFAFNMLEYTEDENRRNLMVSGLLGVFKKMYAESWGPRLEHILRNCLLALAEYPNTSMLGIMRILVDNDYRRKVVAKITNPTVKSFWLDEFANMQEKFRTEAIAPIQNKVGQFLSSPLIRNIVGQVKSTVNIRFMMDTNKIIIVNLSKGKIGEDNSSLLGSMLITKFQLDAMSRADIPEKERKDFYLYVDEFQNFATDAFATILSEARKYRLDLTMANQYIAQMPDEVRDAVFGNVGSIVCFQVGFEDSEFFSGQFSEEVLPNDIVDLPKYHNYTTLMIDGMPSKTFSVSTLPPPEAIAEEGRREKIIRLSRERYGKPREQVEDKILRWSQPPKKLGPGQKDDDDDEPLKEERRRK